MDDNLERRLEQLEKDNAELRKQLEELRAFQGRIRAGLASLLTHKIYNRLDAHDAGLNHHDKRLAELEEWRQQVVEPRGGERGAGSDTAELAQKRLLRGMIDHYFSLEEVRSLAVDVGVDYQDLPRNGKETLIRELVAYCERRGRLGRLVSRCQELRPDMPGWPALFDDVEWV